MSDDGEDGDWSSPVCTWRDSETEARAAILAEFDHRWQTDEAELLQALQFDGAVSLGTAIAMAAKVRAESRQRLADRVPTIHANMQAQAAEAGLLPATDAEVAVLH